MRRQCGAWRLVRDRSQVDRTSDCECDVVSCDTVLGGNWSGAGHGGMHAHKTAFGCSAAADGRLRAPPPRSTRAGHGANSLASWWSVGAEGGGGGAGGAGESLVPDVSAGCNPGGGSNADSSSCAWPRRLAERPHIRRGSEPWSVVPCSGARMRSAVRIAEQARLDLRQPDKRTMRFESSTHTVMRAARTGAQGRSPDRRTSTFARAREARQL